MQNERNVEWTWSSAFWLKKLLTLGALLLTGWLIWWLWQGFDSNDVDTGSAEPTTVQTAVTVTPTVTPVASAVETPAPSTNDFGYTVDAVDADGNAVEPTVNGCLHSYALSSEVTMTVADDCEDLRELSTDFTWTHSSNADGTTATSKDTSYCEPGSTGCNSRGNNIVEFGSWSDNPEQKHVDVRIVSTADSDDISTWQSTYGGVISSIKVQR